MESVLSGTSRLYALPIVAILILITCSPVLAVDQSRGGQTEDPVVDRIIVGLKNYKLVALNDGEVVFDYPVAIGADTGPTPKGQYEVTSRLKNPWYTPDDKASEAPMAPGNPLGSRWIGIDKPSYGIHGTNAPNTIGTRASEGCIRMLNHQVETLYRHVKKGTTVIIKEQLSSPYSRFRSVRNEGANESAKPEEG